MAQNFDMISLLPNSLLLKFISLIPFKEAARTSILSKRWLHLWKYSTNVEFNEHYFSKSYEFSHHQRLIQRRNFLKFIAFWTENNEENFIIEKFSLTLSYFYHEADCEIIERCVAFATQHGVKDLLLDFSDPDWTEEDFEEPEALYELPTKVYEQKALTSLKLISCSFVVTELIRLDGLKEVTFAWMELKTDVIKVLLSNCKMIESLTMKKCWISTKFKSPESNLSLKRIVVDNCNFIYCGLEINAPNLIYFKYYGDVICFKIENSLHMEEVDLDFGLEYEFPEDGGFIYNIITNFNHVKTLNVCSYTLQVLSSELEYMFIEYEMNTRHLKLKTNLHNDECQGVSLLLKNCHVLEILTLDLGFGRFFDRTLDDDDDDDYDYDDDNLSEGDDDYDYTFYGHSDKQRSWVDYQNIWQCLTSTLKIVEINNFMGTENEVSLLHFIINNGSFLQRININVQKGEAVMVENYRKIEKFVMGISRASRYLEIYFRY